MCPPNRPAETFAKHGVAAHVGASHGLRYPDYRHHGYKQGNRKNLKIT